MELDNPIVTRACDFARVGEWDAMMTIRARLLVESEGEYLADYVDGWAALTKGEVVEASHCFEDLSSNIGAANPLVKLALGICRVRQERFSEALWLFEECRRHVHQHPDYVVHYVETLKAHQRHGEALSLLRKTVEHWPNETRIWFNLGNAYRDLKKYEQAIESYERVLTLDPTDVDSRWNRSFLLLLTRKPIPWHLLEDRHLLRPCTLDHRDFAAFPRWVGQSLEGKRICVIGEQGFGDIFQFCRYLEPLIEEASDVGFHASRRIHQLIDANFKVTLWDSKERLPDSYDYYIPLLSLPMFVNVAHCGKPYLRCTPSSFKLPTKRAVKIPRIAIHWQGDSSYSQDRYRSVSLDTLRPILEISGIEWVSIQKGSANAEIECLPSFVELAEAGTMLDIGEAGFLDTASLLLDCELLITTDTAVAHLAGAMGVAVWVMLAAVPDWRWGDTERGYDWYPCMTLYRQENLGEWEPVMKTMADDLFALQSAFSV